MLIIFELANNHNGSLDLGKKIVDELIPMKEKYGDRCHFAIKLQLRQVDSFIHPDYKKSFDTPHIKRFMETKLSENDFISLCNHITDSGFALGVTPFDEPSADLLKNIKTTFIKVASCSASEWPLLDKIVEINRVLVVSTGGLSWDSLDNTYNYLMHKSAHASFLHCVGVYPTPDYLLNMNVIDQMKKRYDTTIGFSDHTPGTETKAVRMAIAKGASIIERHVGWDNLNVYSAHARLEVPKYMAAIDQALDMCGSDSKEISEVEKENLRQLKRGVWAKKDIEMNTAIVQEEVFFAFPNIKGQLLVEEFGEYRACFLAGTNYKTNEPILDHNMTLDKIKKTRTYFHRAKAMLANAGILLNKTCLAELSHHYGFDRFEEYGGVLFDLINREYCQKIIVLLPNQKYPEHSHHAKEETFRIITGTLYITIESSSYEVLPGQTILVDRYRKHYFSAGKQGVIFEEISTTSIKGDSHYEDKEIYKLDPMERKTSIEKL